MSKKYPLLQRVIGGYTPMESCSSISAHGTDGRSCRGWRRIRTPSAGFHKKVCLDLRESERKALSNEVSWEGTGEKGRSHDGRFHPMLCSLKIFVQFSNFS